MKKLYKVQRWQVCESSRFKGSEQPIPQAADMKFVLVYNQNIKFMDSHYTGFMVYPQDGALASCLDPGPTLTLKPFKHYRS